MPRCTCYWIYNNFTHLVRSFLSQVSFVALPSTPRIAYLYLNPLAWPRPKEETADAIIVHFLFPFCPRARPLTSPHSSHPLRLPFTPSPSFGNAAFCLKFTPSCVLESSKDWYYFGSFSSFFFKLTHGLPVHVTPWPYQYRY